MSVVERVPTYGVHYYEVRDRSNLPWYLGISYRGIAQYDYLDKRKPRRVFLVVHTLSSFNLYEDAIEDSRDNHDDLLAAITEATTQVSVSRRTFGPGNVSVYVWFAETQALCKAIWSMAIAQHQFYLDCKTSRNEVSGVREFPELAVELSRSCVSLSTHSSSSNLSRSGSHSSLVNNSLAGVGGYDENTNPNNTTVSSSQESPRDHLRDSLRESTITEGVSLSPALSPTLQSPQGHPYHHLHQSEQGHGGPLTRGHSISSGGVHSAPTSPHKQPNASSRSASPNRPHSGYIPSSVYTRSQYRSQQYPTLSTRSQSVPADEGRVPHPRTTNGAYPVPDPGIVLLKHPEVSTTYPNNALPLLVIVWMTWEPNPYQQ
ncbi:putative FERM domain-containing protein 4A-like isoform X5 [Penaeus vannamei]|uniref:Putative FERM domain-containing protein 4A-like isoform X5 n=1 Tax=Penaeus vannamei TaxID=6689 RepID=A0A423T0C3_PENVA|nr:putative FERM domain-containing protein 4A-like isoform X5 [Penaeus vannamei]